MARFVSGLQGEWVSAHLSTLTPRREVFDNVYATVQPKPLEPPPEIVASSDRARAEHVAGEWGYRRSTDDWRRVVEDPNVVSLIEMTILAQKAGVSRDAFLRFINNSVVGSIFTQYKSQAIVNLDWTTTFTVAPMLKDIDLGLEAARAQIRWLQSHR